MKDYYNILGVSKTAGPEEIKKAYRKLASKMHPDKGGSTEDFQNLQEAYATLSDIDKRAEYDNPSPKFHGFNQGGFHDANFDFDSIFSRFGQHGFNQRQNPTIRMSLLITLQDLALKQKKQVSVNSSYGNGTIEIDIPLGINDGETVHYPKLAPGGLDLLITFRVQSIPGWQRRDSTLIFEQAVSVWTLIAGGDIIVKDVMGNELKLGCPPNTQPNTMLRLRGKGLPVSATENGDLLVLLKAVIPANIPTDLLERIAKETKILP